MAADFVSPENIERCARLTEEFRAQNLDRMWKEDDAAAADNDVVYMDVVFAPIVLVAGGTFTWSSSLYSRVLARDRIGARDLDLYVFSYNRADDTARICIIHSIT